MTSFMTPRNKAIAGAFAKRTARKTGAALAPALGFLLIGLIMMAGLAATTTMMMALALPLPTMGHSFGSWVEQRREWIGALCWALLIAWSAFDLSRTTNLLGQASWSRPFTTALLVLGSGFYIMMDRLAQVFKGVTMGFVPNFIPARAPFVPSAPGSWAACWDPVREVGADYAAALRAFPVGVVTFMAGMMGMALSLAMAPLVLAELAAKWCAGKISQGLSASWGDKARVYADELLAEGSGELALHESKEIGSGVDLAKKDAETPRL